MDSKPGANCGRIAAFGVVQVSWIGVLLHQLRVVNVLADATSHGDFVGFKTVCGQLETACHTLPQIVQEPFRVYCGLCLRLSVDDETNLVFSSHREPE